MIFNNPQLDEFELKVIDRIQELKQRLGYLVDENPRRWGGLLRRNTFARAIRGSNSIEGINITAEDAIAAVEGEEPLDATAQVWAAIQGYRSAMTYVLQLAKDPHFTYSTDLIRSLHYMMIQYDLGKNPGRWRPGHIYVRDDSINEIVYEGPPAEFVPHLMGELMVALSDADSSQPAVITAAMGHLNLAMIHPFSDGNGRMARCLQTLILARTGTLAPQFSSIEEYLGRNTHDYYNVLAEVGAGTWHPERDARPWIRFCLTAHFRQVTTLLRRSREIQKLWDMLEVEINSRGLPPRLIYALSDAAFGYRVRNASYRGIADVTEQVASRDLRLGVDGGLLIAQGERRGRVYIASPILRVLRARVAEPRQVADPFKDVSLSEPYLPGFDMVR
jgi:Fic family protein